jgi:GTP-binding protein
MRVPTADLNRLVADLQVRHDLRRKGRPLKLRYATQVDVAPPRFVFFVNDRSLVHFSYQRYIENQLRLRYGFEGSPIRMHFRERRGE